MQGMPKVLEPSHQNLKHSIKKSPTNIFSIVLAGWLIWILVMVYDNPNITEYNPLSPKQPGFSIPAVNDSRGNDKMGTFYMCQGRSTRYIGDKLIPPLVGNPYNWYINPYYLVDDHSLLYGNYGSLAHIDPKLRKHWERYWGHFPTLSRLLKIIPENSGKFRSC